ncbi:hypothetical protein T439DRAFT_378593 [Meredithblackwellia eburnea MCA 4105]
MTLSTSYISISIETLPGSVKASDLPDSRLETSRFLTPKSEGLVMFFEKDIPSNKRVYYRKDVSLPHVSHVGFSMGPFPSPPRSSGKKYVKHVLHMDMMEKLANKWRTGELKAGRETMGTPCAKGMSMEQAQAMLDGRDSELWQSQIDCFFDLLKVRDTCLNFICQANYVSKEDATFGILAMTACFHLQREMYDYFGAWRNLERATRPSCWSRFATSCSKAFISFSNFNLRGFEI